MDSLKERAAELKKKQEEQASQEQAEKNKNAFELACTPISLSQVRSERHFMRYPLFPPIKDKVPTNRIQKPGRNQIRDRYR